MWFLSGEGENPNWRQFTPRKPFSGETPTFSLVNAVGPPKNLFRNNLSTNFKPPTRQIIFVKAPPKLPDLNGPTPNKS